MLQNIKVLLRKCFYNISLKVLRSTFSDIYNLPFSRSRNIGKIRVNVGPYFNYFMSSCTNRTVLFYIFFSLISSLPNDKQNRSCNFFLFKYFLNNLFPTIFMQTTLSKFVELLKKKKNE